MAYFNIYKASAGSGKTYTLVKEYIKRGLSTNNHLAHKSLLAITFTNKAASEMKTRIVETLFHFSQGFKNIKDESCQQLYCDLKLELKYHKLRCKQNKKTYSYQITKGQTSYKLMYLITS